MADRSENKHAGRRQNALRRLLLVAELLSGAGTGTVDQLHALLTDSGVTCCDRTVRRDLNTLAAVGAARTESEPNASTIFHWVGFKFNHHRAGDNAGGLCLNGGCVRTTYFRGLCLDCYRSLRKTIAASVLPIGEAWVSAEKNRLCLPPTTK